MTAYNIISLLILFVASYVAGVIVGKLSKEETKQYKKIIKTISIISATLTLVTAIYFMIMDSGYGFFLGTTVITIFTFGIPPKEKRKKIRKFYK